MARSRVSTLEEAAAVRASKDARGRIRSVIDLTDEGAHRYQQAFGQSSALHQHVMPVEAGRRGLGRLRSLVKRGAHS